MFVLDDLSAIRLTETRSVYPPNLQVPWVFLEEEAEDCVCMSVRKASARAMHSCALSKGGREVEGEKECEFWDSHPPSRLLMSKEVRSDLVVSVCVCAPVYSLHPASYLCVCGVIWRMCKVKCFAGCCCIFNGLLELLFTKISLKWGHTAI